MIHLNGEKIEIVAHLVDEALDSVYHYGRSKPGRNFGWLANVSSTEQAVLSIERDETDIEKISEAVHIGWALTAIADADGRLHLDVVTPLEKQHKRFFLAQIQYKDLSEEEKEKDRVIARTVLNYIKQNETVK